jgi:hypothetical protein
VSRDSLILLPRLQLRTRSIFTSQTDTPSRQTELPILALFLQNLRQHSALLLITKLASDIASALGQTGSLHPVPMNPMYECLERQVTNSLDLLFLGYEWPVSPALIQQLEAMVKIAWDALRRFEGVSDADSEYFFHLRYMRHWAVRPERGLE